MDGTRRFNRRLIAMVPIVVGLSLFLLVGALGETKDPAFPPPATGTETLAAANPEPACAAALATVMRYHWDDDVTELNLLRETVQMLTVEELKERIENGLAMTDLRRLAVRVGYLSTIGRLEFDKLRESKIPLIMGIVINDFDHFVVYRGTDGQYVYLADPARGNVRTPIAEFLGQWQKNMVLVVVKPGEAPELWSPLLLQRDETLLGESNRLYLRDRVITKVFPH